MLVTAYMRHRDLRQYCPSAPLVERRNQSTYAEAAERMVELCVEVDGRNRCWKSFEESDVISIKTTYGLPDSIA